MEQSDAVTLCWVFGVSGLVASSVLQLLYWWQAAEVRESQAWFFSRTYRALIPTLYWAVYSLLLTPSHSTPHPLPHILLPHSALLSSSLVCAVSLSGLALCLLPSAPDSLQADAKTTLLAALGLLFLSLASSAYLSFSPFSLHLFAALCVGAAAFLPGYTVLNQMNAVTCGGQGHRGWRLTGLELACSATWAAYGLSSGDMWVQGSNVILGVLQAALIFLALFVEFNQHGSDNQYGAGSWQRSGGIVGRGADGYEMVPHGPDSLGDDQLSPASSSAMLPSGDLDAEFDDWLQQDVFLGKRLA